MGVLKKNLQWVLQFENMILICPSERNLRNAYSIHSIMNRSFLFSTFRARNLENDTLFFYFSSSSFFITKIMTDSSFHTTKTRKYTHTYIYIYILASASLGSSRVYSFSRPRHHPYYLKEQFHFSLVWRNLVN